MNKHCSLLTATVLLLLPMLYVGSYMALVKPNSAYGHTRGYRYDGIHRSATFWPLEKIHRALSADEWEGGNPNRLGS